MVAGPRLAAGLQPFTGRKDHPRDTGFGARTDDASGKGGLEPESVGGIKEVRTSPDPSKLDDDSGSAADSCSRFFLARRCRTFE